MDTIVKALNAKVDDGNATTIVEALKQIDENATGETIAEVIESMEIGGRASGTLEVQNPKNWNNYDVEGYKYFKPTYTYLYHEVTVVNNTSANISCGVIKAVGPNSLWEQVTCLYDNITIPANTSKVVQIPYINDIVSKPVLVVFAAQITSVNNGTLTGAQIAITSTMNEWVIVVKNGDTVTVA